MQPRLRPPPARAFLLCLVLSLLATGIPQAAAAPLADALPGTGDPPVAAPDAPEPGSPQDAALPLDRPADAARDADALARCAPPGATVERPCDLIPAPGPETVGAADGPSAAAVLFQDDFNAGGLDPTKWTIQNPGYSVVVANQRLEVTVQEQVATIATVKGASVSAVFDATRGVDANVQMARNVAGNGWVARPDFRLARSDNANVWVDVIYNPFYGRVELRDSAGTNLLLAAATPVGYHNVRIVLTGSGYTGYYDSASLSVSSTLFNGAPGFSVVLEDWTGGSTLGATDTSARDNVVVYDHSSAAGSLPYSQGFNSGSAPGWSLSGLWHVTDCRSSSPSYSLGYNKVGCPTNFDTGAATTGAAVTPSLAIPAGTTPVKLTWASWHSTEAGTTYDRKTVSITTNGGASWTQLWQEDGTQGIWNSRELDITGYAGNTIKIRFLFDSVDGVANTGEGWYVDNVVVEKLTTTVPSAPQNLVATAGPNPGQIRLTWNAPASNGGSPITGYNVYRATSCSGTFSFLTALGASTLTYTDGGLGNGVFRCYRVTASNSLGEGPASNTAGATTWTTPGAPQNPTATPGPGLQQIQVCWSPPASDGGTAITSYRVHRSANGGASYGFLASTGSTCYTDSGLTLLQTYHYRVSAVNAVGEGPQSAAVCAKPHPSPGGC